MPLSAEQEALCERLEKGESTPTAATLIRHQAREIDDLWDRLSRAYALIRQELPAEIIQDEMEQLRLCLTSDATQNERLKPFKLLARTQNGPKFCVRVVRKRRCPAVSSKFQITPAE